MARMYMTVAIKESAMVINLGVVDVIQGPMYFSRHGSDRMTAVRKRQQATGSSPHIVVEVRIVGTVVVVVVVKLRIEVSSGALIAVVL